MTKERKPALVTKKTKENLLVAKENLLEPPGDTRDLDSLLGNGRYQLFQIWVLQTIIAIVGALNYYHLVFMVSDPPEWECQDPNQEKCPEGINNQSLACGGGDVVFNRSHQNFLHSLAVENMWLCGEQVRGAGVLTAFYLGQILNSLVFGQLCDKWGRRPVFHITNILFVICRLLSFYLYQHYLVFLILTALGSGFFPVGVRAGYTIVAEVCDGEARKFAFISGWVFWVLGLAALPFLAKYVGDWFSLGLATTLINLTLTAAYPLLPESPRWLLGKGKFDEAAKIIAQMRRINKDPEIKNLPQVLERMSRKEGVDSQKGEGTEDGLLKALRTWSIVRVAVCLALVWSVNDYFYIAGSMNVENLAGDMFVNFSLLALTELPSVFVGQFLIDRLGRRWVHAGCMLTATLAMLVSTLLAANPDLGTAVVGLTVCSKIFSNVGWFIMWVQCIELFPTPLRGTGMNVSVMISTLITMTGPYVVDLGSLDMRYPFLVFTMFGMVGTATTVLLPETKGRPLPERLEDIDQLVASFRFFSWRTWREVEHESEEGQGAELESLNSSKE